MKAIYLVILGVLFYSIQNIDVESILRIIFHPKEMKKVRHLKDAQGSDDYALDFIGMVQKHSYPTEEHNVTTTDGYQLVLHRIPYSPFRNNTQTKGVVYMQHAAFASTEIYVLTGPRRDLAFMLADAGYDVWLGNWRGNSYSKTHVNLTFTDRDYWRFSDHEYGLYDTPALIDYVLNYTKKPSLYYIGHSLGATTAFMLLSLKPEYNKKIDLAIHFSPAVFSHRGISWGSWILTSTITALKGVLESYGIHRIYPQSVSYKEFTRYACDKSSRLQYICAYVVSSVMGGSVDQDTTQFSHRCIYYPNGGIARIVYHYQQTYLSGEFRAYDYGNTENYVRYNQETPPLYDLSKVTSPQVIFYAANDRIIFPANIIELVKHLQNVDVFEVPSKDFSHSDFVTSNNVKTLLYDKVLEIIETY